MPIQDLNVHFIHEKSDSPKAIPMIMIHGWPGSVWEFHKIIPQLTKSSSEEEQTFHMVCPSIPGYGFSDPPKEPGMNIAKVADMFHELMIQLGYNQYIAQGGDWGALISKQMAMRYPRNCVLLHQIVAVPPTKMSFGLKVRIALSASPKWRSLMFSKKAQEGFTRSMEYSISGTGYLLLQASKPHTLGYALSDSPAGLLAWICEKCSLWADCREDGGLFNVLSKDEILTNVMIYWVTNTITSSMRLYYETFPIGKQFKDKVATLQETYVEVPTAVTYFPKEIVALPLAWLRYGYNIVHFSEFTKGGHFAAWEQPEVLAKDLRSFVLRVPFERACKLANKRKVKISI
jgi:pimeloyl-ACP methyl ester carboxylesterase